MKIAGLSLSNSFEHSQVFSFADSIDYQKDAVVSKTLVKKETGTISLFAFDAEQGLSEHSAPFDALIQVVEGLAEIRIAGQPYTVASGQSIIMPASVPHSVHAPERFKMILTMIRG
jgi:quercetin dioxygenase-like cupin family protein